MKCRPVLRGVTWLPEVVWLLEERRARKDTNTMMMVRLCESTCIPGPLIATSDPHKPRRNAHQGLPRLRSLPERGGLMATVSQRRRRDTYAGVLRKSSPRESGLCQRRRFPEMASGNPFFPRHLPPEISSPAVLKATPK